MKPTRLYNILLLPIFGLFISVNAYSSPIEELSAGYNYFNACHDVSIRKSASPWAPNVGKLLFGTEVKIQKVVKKFELEASDENSKEKLELSQNEDSDIIDEERYTRHIWVGIKKGMIPASCLVSSEELLDIKELEGRIKKITSSKAKRNFSEDEKGDQTAMRGAAGQARFGKPNFSFADSLIDIAKIRNYNDMQKTKSFRESGFLGEFK